MNLNVILLSVLLGLTTNVNKTAFPVEKPSDNTIYGRITDYSTGEELAGVKVVLKVSGESVYTDFNGEFEFGNLRPGDSYSIETEYISYQNKIIRDIQPGKGIKIRLKDRNSRVVNKLSPAVPAV